MTLTIIIAAVTIIAMITVVLVKPYITVCGHNLGLYWIVCLLGAVLMLVCGCITPAAVFDGITAKSSVNPLKILTLFLSMTLLSVYLGDAGFFDFIADSIFLRAKGGKVKLFLILYAVVSILTVFTSNDVIILTFTPPICIFARKAKISPLPFLLGEFVAANTWSMTLIIGNPTNVYLAQSAGITFAEYLSVMYLPALLGGLTGLGMIFLLFKKELLSPIKEFNGNLPVTRPDAKVKIHKTPMLVAIFHLLACIILLSISDIIGVEMYLICLTLALSLTVFDLIYDLAVEKSAAPVWRSIKKEPYELIPFVLSMFVIVLALKTSGAIEVLNKILISGNLSDGISIGFLSAAAAKLLNNIPMSVMFESIIGQSSYPAVFGAVIGSNVGAFITPVGALAGIMWSKILGNYGVKFPFRKFVMYGTAIAIPTLIASLGGLLITLAV